MSKAYWNGVLNKLPNFCKDMGKLCMQTAAMDYAFRNRGCCGPSVFGAPGAMFPGGGITGGQNMGTYWDNQGMMQSVFGDSSSSSGYTQLDDIFAKQLEQLFPKEDTAAAKAAEEADEAEEA